MAPKSSTPGWPRHLGTRHPGVSTTCSSPTSFYCPVTPALPIPPTSSQPGCDQNSSRASVASARGPGRGSSTLRPGHTPALVCVLPPWTLLEPASHTPALGNLGLSPSLCTQTRPRIVLSPPAHLSLLSQTQIYSLAPGHCHSH